MPKVQTGVSIDADLKAKAKEKRINITTATERGIKLMLEESMTGEEKLKTETDKLVQAQDKIALFATREILDSIRKHLPLSQMNKDIYIELLKTDPRYIGINKSLEELITIAEKEYREGHT